MFVTTFVTNAIFDVWSPCIQEHFSCIFILFINIGLFFLLVMSRLLSMLRSKLRHGSSLLNLIHHISTVILRWLHRGLFFNIFTFLFKPLDFKLEVIIFFIYSFITRLYKNLLNIRILALSIKSINIYIIASFITITSGGFGSFRCALLKALKCLFK
jgi:hypothetical protein